MMPTLNGTVMVAPTNRNRKNMFLLCALLICSRGLAVSSSYSSAIFSKKTKRHRVSPIYNLIPRDEPRNLQQDEDGDIISFDGDIERIKELALAKAYDDGTIDSNFADADTQERLGTTSVVLVTFASAALVLIVVSVYAWKKGNRMRKNKLDMEEGCTEPPGFTGQSSPKHKMLPVAYRFTDSLCINNGMSAIEEEELQSRSSRSSDVEVNNVNSSDSAVNNINSSDAGCFERSIFENAKECGDNMRQGCGDHAPYFDDCRLPVYSNKSDNNNINNINNNATGDSSWGAGRLEEENNSLLTPTTSFEVADVATPVQSPYTANNPTTPVQSPHTIDNPITSPGTVDSVQPDESLLFL